MKPFPVELLKPNIGVMRQVSTAVGPNITIEVPFAAFELPELEEDGPISTSLRLEFVNLPTADPSKLTGKEYRFPLNPASGYIDASIYIDSKHHPVDVTLLRFGAPSDDAIRLEIELEFVFEHEGLEDFSNTKWTCQTAVRGR